MQFFISFLYAILLNYIHKTSLFIAVEQENVEMVKLLLSHNLNVNIKYISFICFNIILIFLFNRIGDIFLQNCNCNFLVLFFNNFYIVENIIYL